MNLARILIVRRIGIVLPALGLGWMLATVAWGQSSTGVATTPVTVTGDVKAPAAGSILKEPPETKPAQTSATVTGGIVNGAAPVTDASAQTTAGGEVRRVVVEIEDLGARLTRLTQAQREKWLQASAALPGFCQDWNRMLHDREVNNLSHLEWHEQQGYKTATYTGYGQVQACQAKESEEGVPIGKVTYQEMSYYLAGKSEDEAKSHPKLVGTTSTLEIFSWEKDRWFY